jgi:hypothetical protein
MTLQTSVSRTLTAALLMGLASQTSAMAPVTVTTGNDSGEGSLRAALASGATRIIVGPSVNGISIDSTLVYNGQAPLTLIGLGQTISANRSGDDFTLLEVSNGANLSIDNLRFDGGGEFDFDNAGNGKAIYLQVPTDREGMVMLELRNVNVRGVANHGIHVSDCTLGDDCGGGEGGGGDGSPASIHVTLESVTIQDVGYGRFDADGLRVDERAAGNIVFEGRNVNVFGAGADGIELDEGNEGDVIVYLRHARLEGNGGYCLPAPLDLSEPCVEDDDGELVLDLDDGFDIDEAGPGMLLGTLIDIAVNENLDEGLDFDAEGEGVVEFKTWKVEGMLNGDEALKISAGNSGNVMADLRGLFIVGNGNDGVQIEAEDSDTAKVHVELRGALIAGNDGDGLKISQENTTELGTLDIYGFANIDVLDLDNVEQR